MNKKRRTIKITMYISTIIVLLTILIIKYIDIFLFGTSKSLSADGIGEKEVCDLSTHYLEYDNKIAGYVCIKGEVKAE